MNKLADKKWWEAAGTRVIRTVAQAAITAVGVSTAIQEWNWAVIGGSVAAMAILTLLTALASLPEVEE